MASYPGSLSLVYSTREGEPFTAFIDGANIGYYMQNFEHGKFNIYQVEFMVNALENMGENALVIMPQKYCLPSFNTSGSRGDKQKLDKDEMAIIERFVECDCWSAYCMCQLMLFSSHECYPL